MIFPDFMLRSSDRFDEPFPILLGGLNTFKQAPPPDLPNECGKINNVLMKSINMSDGKYCYYRIGCAAALHKPYKNLAQNKILGQKDERKSEILYFL